MDLDLEILLLELCLELIRAVLTGVMCDDDAADVESLLEKLFAQTEHIHIIGDPEIAAHLILFDVGGADDNDNFRIVGELHQHAQLGVGSEAGENAGRMIIVEELSAELKVELVPKLIDALLDVFRLHFQIFFIVKTAFHVFARAFLSFVSKYESYSTTKLYALE